MFILSNRQQLINYNIKIIIKALYEIMNIDYSWIIFWFEDSLFHN